MIAAFFDERLVSSFLFLGSILLMLGSMLLLNREIQIANTALDVHLSDLETNQEWEQNIELLFNSKRPSVCKYIEIC